jgi:epoxyqueuosine reductase
MNLKESLRREARRLGFLRLGFVSAKIHPAAVRLRQWLDLDYAGEMVWLHRRYSERADPKSLIPWARTILVAALPYSSLEPGNSHPGSARISRYARGRDYHEVMKGRLGKLGKFLSEISPGARSSPVVDTGAVLEKPWAASAGLGWQGKHTNLIDPESGSWFFLGELVTDLDLEPDPASVTDRCGSCTRCLEACPTQAFPEPYVLDAKKCISYLTIEHRGTIPEELRAGMGNWVFGCDVCQEVCPWNHDPVQGDAAFEENADAPALTELIRMSREEFHRRFAGTPLRRTGWRRFVRNVAVALGNSGDPRAVEPLRDALAIPDPLIQEHVRWALRRLGAESSASARVSAGLSG